MSFCPRCGKETTTGAGFCGSCGLALTAAPATPAYAPPPPGPSYAPPPPYGPHGPPTDPGHSPPNAGPAGMPPGAVATGKPPVTQGTAIAGLLLNIFIWPGLGTLVVGDKRGWAQGFTALAGAILLIVLVGIPILIAAWIWALVTSIQTLQAAK